jgi:hypothetical protein
MNGRSRLASLGVAERIFATAAMLMLALGMAVAGLQTYVKQIRHDVRVFSEYRAATASGEAEAGKGGAAEAAERKPLLDEWKFQWLLTYTHIHSFSMAFVFFFAGALYLMSGASVRAKIGWTTLPFAGILLDLAGLWLRQYCCGAWAVAQYLGGTLFGAAFLVMFVTVMKDLWINRQTPSP